MESKGTRKISMSKQNWRYPVESLNSINWRSRLEPSNSNWRYRLESSPWLYEKKPFPFYSKPVELGTLSYRMRKDTSFNIIRINSRKDLKSFVPPEDWNCCNFNLRHGYESMIDKEPGICARWIWIMQNVSKFIHPPPSCQPPGGYAHSSPNTNGVFKSLNVDFVCGRCILTQLVCTPYEKMRGFKIVVVRFRGTYYIMEAPTEAKIEEFLQALLKKQDTQEELSKKEKETPEELSEKQEDQAGIEEKPSHAEMCYWGFKFEQYVTAKAGMETPDTSSPVDPNQEFDAVLYSQLGPHTMLFFAEIDCEDKNCKTEDKYVELKTSRLIETEREHFNFCRYKLLKCWAQCFLGGVPRVVFGFRDDNGIVRQLKEYPVLEMPDIANAKRKTWTSAGCFNFLSALFQFIKSAMPADTDKSGAYVFRWEPGSDVTYEKVDNPNYYFIPKYFINWRVWDKPYSEAEAFGLPKRKKSDRPPKSHDRPPETHDRPAESGNKPPESGDRPTASGDRPTASHDKPPERGDTPPERGDRPPEGLDKPPESRDKPPERGDRPPEGLDTPPESGDKPPESGDKPPESDDRPPESGNRPLKSHDRPPPKSHDRPESPEPESKPWIVLSSDNKIIGIIE